ncbi:MAG: PIN domain-containing protein [Bacteroidaceae bacterium]|nr:PIN domain-containing protein [Bacteroidaceae bacterium]MBR1801088.1 PIN domain-containing protein [Bacteroidaceae bacterium]
MKIFLDTNIFIEYIEERKEVDAVEKILKAVADGEHEGVLSQGAFYTLAFLIERVLKEKGIHRPLQTQMLRRLLSDIQATARVVGVSHENLSAALHDIAFTDLEDSFQYRCALENRCDVLLTINLKDYKNVNHPDLRILTPSDFVQQYITE